MGQFRYNVANAVAWQIIYQLVRTYTDRYDLRVFELHPGGGQYDCLSLRYMNHKNKFGRGLFDINVASGNLHYFGTVESSCSKADGGRDIIKQYLSANDPKTIVDDIRLRLRMPPADAIPPSNGQVLAIGLIAAIAQKFTFSRKVFSARMGYCDSSGYDSGFRKELELFDITKPIIEKREQMKAYRYFLFHSDYHGEDKPFALVDMSGFLYFPDNSSMELTSKYQACNRSLSALAEKVTANIKF